MRSVSIVYRKQNHPNANAPVLKRSLDHYYNHLLQKEKNRDAQPPDRPQAALRAKLRTSRSQRNSDQLNILETLSIAQIALRQPAEERREEARREKGLLARKLEGCRTVLKGLNLPQSLLPEEDEEGPQRSSHCRLRNLFMSRPTEHRDTVIALSANFVIDEHYFWQEEAVDELAAKNWKVLQNYAAVVWLCQREATAKKLVKFSKANGLRLDAAYLIVPRKGRRNLTVSYQLIESDFGVGAHKSSSPLLGREERKMIAINGLLVEQTRDLHFSCFYQAVPVIKNYRSVVHFLKVEPSDKGRLGSVVRLLSQSTMPKPLNLLRVLQDYERRAQEERQQSCSCRAAAAREEVSVLQRLQELKTRTMKYFSVSLSVNLNDRISYDESENSIQFIIGDLLRRNYRIFQNYYQYIEQHRQHQHHLLLHAHATHNLPPKTAPTHRYRNPAYLWQF